MHLRKLGGIFLLACGLLLFSGCESTSGGDGSTVSEGEKIRREGGSVRSTTFHPTMPAEVNEADYRYW